MNDPVFGVAMMFGLMAVALSWVHRKERNKLRVSLACKDAVIEKMTGDMLALMDERNRYKAALSALVPPPGVVYETRIVRPAPTVEEQIDRMLGRVNYEDPR